MAKKMRQGECRKTKRGQTYCKFADNRVRFVPLGGFGKSKMVSSLAGRRRGRRGKMKIGECRRTRNGVKYCKTRKGVRFKRG